MLLSSTAERVNATKRCVRAASTHLIAFLSGRRMDTMDTLDT